MNRKFPVYRKCLADSKSDVIIVESACKIDHARKSHSDQRIRLAKQIALKKKVHLTMITRESPTVTIKIRLAKHIAFKKNKK